jgi:ribokinase
MIFDVIGFGALNIDKLYKVNKIASAEEESFIYSYEEVCGGSAANTVVGLARLGLKTGYIGKLAMDEEGRKLLEEFKREGVNIDGIVVSETGRSGTVLGFVDPKGERALYVDPGVNDTLDFEEISVEYASKTRFLHLTSFVGEKTFQTQEKLVENLPGNVKLTIDPGELYARKGLHGLKLFIRRAFAVIPNAGELKLLTGEDNYEKGAERLLAEGVKIVAVKLGRKGCYVTNGQEEHLVPSLKVQVVDTTGAGDAFSAGFIYGLTTNQSLKKCGEIGNFVASRCITRIGARNGLPTLRELKQAIKLQ